MKLKPTRSRRVDSECSPLRILPFRAASRCIRWYRSVCRYSLSKGTAGNAPRPAPRITLSWSCAPVYRNKKPYRYVKLREAAHVNQSNTFSARLILCSNTETEQLDRKVSGEMDGRIIRALTCRTTRAFQATNLGPATAHCDPASASSHTTADAHTC